MLNFSYRLCIIPGTHQSIFVTLFLYQNHSPNNWDKNILIVFPNLELEIRLPNVAVTHFATHLVLT